MANQKLVDYIKEGKKRGFSLEILKNKLTEGGFVEDDVNEAAAEVGKSGLPELPKKTMETPVASEIKTEKKSSVWKWIIIIFLLLVVVGLGLFIYLKWFF